MYMYVSMYVCVCVYVYVCILFISNTHTHTHTHTNTHTHRCCIEDRSAPQSGGGGCHALGEATRARVAYMCKPMSMIDMLSLVPYYIDRLVRKFPCFTSTKVQILTQKALLGCGHTLVAELPPVLSFSCFTGTKVQILTPDELHARTIRLFRIFSVFKWERPLRAMTVQ